MGVLSRANQIRALLGAGLAACLVALLYSRSSDGFEVIVFAALAMIPTQLASFFAYNHPDKIIAAKLVQYYRVALLLQIFITILILLNFFEANSIPLW